MTRATAIDGVTLDPPELLAKYRAGTVDCAALRREVTARTAKVETRLRRRTWYRLHMLPVVGEAEFADEPAPGEVLLRIAGRRLIALVDGVEVARTHAPRLSSGDADCTSTPYARTALGDPHTRRVVVGYGFQAENAGNTCEDGGTFEVKMAPAFFAAIADAPTEP